MKRLTRLKRLKKIADNQDFSRDFDYPVNKDYEITVECTVKKRFWIGDARDASSAAASAISLMKKEFDDTDYEVSNIRATGWR